jgi:hypothetical protein
VTLGRDAGRPLKSLTLDTYSHVLVDGLTGLEAVDAACTSAPMGTHRVSRAVGPIDIRCVEANDLSTRAEEGQWPLRPLRNERRLCRKS